MSYTLTTRTDRISIGLTSNPYTVSITPATYQTLVSHLGRQGVGVESAEIDVDKDLLLHLTDGTTINAGNLGVWSLDEITGGALTEGVIYGGIY